MGSGQDDFTIEILLEGATRKVDISPYDFGNGKQLKCRMIWEDEPLEFWLHFKTGLWQFKKPAQVPKEISKHQALFNRTLKAILK